MDTSTLIHRHTPSAPPSASTAAYDSGSGAVVAWERVDLGFASAYPSAVAYAGSEDIPSITVSRR